MENNMPPVQPPPLIPNPPNPPSQIIVTTAPQRGGRGWMFLSFLLLLVLAVIVLGKVSSLMFGAGKQVIGSESGHHFEEVTVENGASPDKIAIIDVSGIITSEPWDRTGRS